MSSKEKEEADQQACLRAPRHPPSPTMFDIELSLPGSSSHTVILRRDYQEFRALHLALTNLLTSSKVRYEA